MPAKEKEEIFLLVLVVQHFPKNFLSFFKEIKILKDFAFNDLFLYIVLIFRLLVFRQKLTGLIRKLNCIFCKVIVN